MINICRLCLSYDSLQLSSIKEVIDKLHTCFSINLLLNHGLPDKACCKCIEKINELFKFYNEILKNEEILLQYSTLGKENFITFLKKQQCCNKNTKELQNIDVKFENCDEYFDQTDNVFNSEEKDSVIDAKENNYTAAKVEYKTKLEKFNHLQTESEFMCLTCFEKFQSTDLLLQHYKKDHLIKGQSCTDNFTVEMLNDKIHYNCKGCDETFPSKSRLKQHAVKHCPDRPFICKLCGRTYKTAIEILNHRKAHGGIKINCSFNCGFSSAYTGALKNHERRHLTEFKFVCEECNKGFFEKTTFDQHQNIHKGVKPYVCEVCEMAFHMERYLKRHQITHPQPPSEKKKHVCLQCYQPFDTTHYLQSHMWSEHKIKQCLLCDTCGKSFRKVKLLNDHMKTHDESLERFKCRSCDKTFRKKSNLSRHEEAHAGLTHDCQGCGKNFSQKSSLSRHLKGRCKSAFPRSKTKES